MQKLASWHWFLPLHLSLRRILDPSDVRDGIAAFLTTVCFPFVFLSNLAMKEKSVTVVDEGDDG